MVRNFAVNFAYDEPVNAVRDFRRLGRAQKRHDDIVHATKKRESRRQRIERCPEDGKYFYYPYRDEALRRLDQPGRWTKYVGGNAAGYVKYYPGWDIEKANVAEKALRRAEKIDEEIADFADILLDAFDDSVADEADYLLDELEFENMRYYNAVCGAALLQNKNVIGNANEPGIAYYSESEEQAMKFWDFIHNNGGCPVWIDKISYDVAIGAIVNIDKEWNEDTSSMESYYWKFVWKYGTEYEDLVPFVQTKKWHFNA